MPNAFKMWVDNKINWKINLEATPKKLVGLILASQ
jgi:hypothetical protein